MQLTKSFTLEEMLASQYATRHGIKEQFAPPPEVVDNLKALCENILQPLRDIANHSIHISSGYRCAATNKGVKGSKTSQHLTGQAADIQDFTKGNAWLFNTIQELKLPFCQLIWEFGNAENPAWVHVSYDPKNIKRQILYIK